MRLDSRLPTSSVYPRQMFPISEIIITNHNLSRSMYFSNRVLNLLNLGLMTALQYPWFVFSL